jgi:hypothetical protein
VIRSVQWSIALFGALCLVVFAGCPAGSAGPNTAPVKGTLTIDGQPANNVSITFSPMDKAGTPATGQVTNGSFELKSGSQGKPGAVPGKYKVVLAQALGSADAAMAAYKKGGGAPKAELSFPEKYTKAETSDKEVEVKSGPNDIKIEITK